MGNEMGNVYGLVDSCTMELRYVGKTVRPLKVRLRAHLQCRSPNSHLNNWLRSARVSAVVLERAPEDLAEAEIRWIRKMREQGARLLNMTDGGNGGRTRGSTGRKLTAEHRAKIGAGLMGREVTEAHRAKMRGYRATDETRAKISASLMGRPVTEETRAKHRNQVWTPARRAKISAVNVRRWKRWKRRGHVRVG